MKTTGRCGFTGGLMALIVCVVFGFGAQALAGDAKDADALRLAKALSNAYASVVEKVVPSVVGIQRVVKAQAVSGRLQAPDGRPEDPGDEEDMLRRFFERMPQQRSQPMMGYGSGVIIDTEGHILTNNHVVQDADKLIVEFSDEVKCEATIVGRDPKTDIAVIQLKDFKGTLTPARLGDSEQLRVGNIVLAIGSPFRLKHTVTTGIVSAKNRDGLGMTMYENYIQTDASINPGNSGGPLVNLDGEVVGINTLIHSRSGGSEGVGFAVPIDMAREVMEQLLKSGEVTRGWLGVGINDVTPEMAAVMRGVEGGVAVTEVYEGTPAADGGMQPGDVIVSFGGNLPASSRHLQKLVAATPPGTTVPVEIVRQGQRVKLNVTVGKQPENPMAAGTPDAEEKPGGKIETESERLGIKVQNVDDRLRRLFSLPKEEKGVVVIKVLPDSPAEEAGMGAGAFILELDQKPTPDTAAFDTVAASLADKKSALVLFRQDGRNRFSVLHFK